MRTGVYINRNLSKVEAQRAYRDRQRREALQQRQQQSQSIQCVTSSSANPTNYSSATPCSYSDNLRLIPTPEEQLDMTTVLASSSPPVEGHSSVMIASPPCVATSTKPPSHLSTPPNSAHCTKRSATRLPNILITNIRSIKSTSKVDELERILFVFSSYCCLLGVLNLIIKQNNAHVVYLTESWLD